MTGSPTRVVMVTARYPPLIGGTEIHTAEVARRLRDRGVDVQVLTTHLDGSAPVTEERDGVPVRSIPAWSRGGSLHVAPTLRSELEALEPDVVHVQGYHTYVAPAAMRASRSLGVPHVVTFHSGGHQSSLRNLIRPVHHRALAKSFRAADALVAVSGFEADLFSGSARIPRERIRVIPSGTELEFTPRSEAPEGTIITSLGRLARFKGHDRLIRALPHLRRHHPDARLRIIGRGPDEKRLRRLADRAGVAPHVEFTSVPSTERARMVQLLQESSLVALLSAYESQGLAAYEAIFVGVDVLVSTSSALAELVEAGVAHGVDASTSDEALADRIVEVLAAPSRACDARPPTWDDTVDALQATYDEVLESGAASSATNASRRN